MISNAYLTDLKNSTSDENDIIKETELAKKMTNGEHEKSCVILLHKILYTKN